MIKEMAAGKGLHYLYLGSRIPIRGYASISSAVWFGLLIALLLSFLPLPHPPPLKSARYSPSASSLAPHSFAESRSL